MTLAKETEEVMPMRSARDEIDSSTLDKLLDEILTDAYGDDEQLWAFRQVFEDNVELPADAFVIGEPVSVTGIDYDGNERRGLTATCQRENGSEHGVAAAELAFAERSAGALHVAAYRKWLGLEPFPATVKAPATPVIRTFPAR